MGGGAKVYSNSLWFSTGFDDTESLVTLEDDQIAICEEDLNTINICSLPSGSATATMTITKDTDCDTYIVSPHFETTHNKGIEGLTCNPEVRMIVLGVVFYVAG